MLKKSINDSVVGSAKMQVCRIMFPFLGGIFCGLLSVSVAAGEVQKFSLNNLGTADALVQRIPDRNDFKKRRDPFRPMKKPRSISSSSRKSRPEPQKIPPPVPRVKDPNWKLLGVIHGQYGRQAVIQISPGKRIFVRPGLELVQSGWIIKTISKGEVLLERRSITPSGTDFPQPRIFILSFPTPGKSR